MRGNHSEDKGGDNNSIGVLKIKTRDGIRLIKYVALKTTSTWQCQKEDSVKMSLIFIWMEELVWQTLFLLFSPIMLGVDTMANEIIVHLKICMTQ